MYTPPIKIRKAIQSNLSVTPPWPGINLPKSFYLYALLYPLAIKPPKGATKAAKEPQTKI